MKNRNLILPSMLAGFALAASANSATIVVAENFGGLAADILNGKTADTFSSGITAAGGSDEWVANAAFKADGSADGNRKSAHLNLGNYINSTKGTANGIFVLQATLAQPSTTGDDRGWFSLGFSSLNSPDTACNFLGDNVGNTVDLSESEGVGTMIYRANGAITQWAGPGTANPVTGGTGSFGPRILTITLDLSGYDGITNFGTVTFGANTGIDGAYAEYGSHKFTAEHDFSSILLSISGFTKSDDVDGSYGSLTLTQIPEPQGDFLVN